MMQDRKLQRAKGNILTLCAMQNIQELRNRHVLDFGFKEQ
jgi:hypothetical protein